MWKGETMSLSVTAPRCPTCAKYPTLYPPECPKYSAHSALSSSERAEFNKFVQDANNYEESRVQTYSSPAGPRKFWEEWDLRILILYILCTQLCLLIFGRIRRSKWKIFIALNVRLQYIIADSLALAALGGLSQVKDGGTLNKDAVLPEFNPNEISSTDKPENLLRGLWAAIILFYLGGPDTITLLYIEETHVWMKHLLSLLAQGARTCYILSVTWTPSGLSVLSLLMLISGIIKYAERIWVIESKSRTISEGFLEPNDCTAFDFVGYSPTSPNRKLELKRNTELVVEGYSCFQTFKPHIPRCHARNRLDKFIKENRTSEHIFKHIEIELGFMYDVLFSKVGTIFTAWGFSLRYITLSCVVCVLVGFFMVDKPSTKDSETDFQITIILLLGAIFLEMVGLLVQLVSDWAVVWAWEHQSKLSSPVLFLREHLISGRQRWSKEVGQFSLLNFCCKYEATVFNKMVRAVCGWETLLSINFSLPSRKVNWTIKELIINQLRERSWRNSGQPSRVSAEKAGVRTILNYELHHERRLWKRLDWIMNEDFGQAIVLWHLATDICYHSEDEEPTDVSEAAKIMSYYMMHLLLMCPNRVPFSNTDGDFLTACKDIMMGMEIPKYHKLTLAEACRDLEHWKNKKITVKCAKDLASALMQKPKMERWKILTSMWVEMLCHAAMVCKLKYHAQELRNGGEFLTHVWLLLMHFGIIGDQERIIGPK